MNTCLICLPRPASEENDTSCLSSYGGWLGEIEFSQGFLRKQIKVSKVKKFKLGRRKLFRTATYKRRSEARH